MGRMIRGKDDSTVSHYICTLSYMNGPKFNICSAAFKLGNRCVLLTGLPTSTHVEWSLDNYKAYLSLTLNASSVERCTKHGDMRRYVYNGIIFKHYSGPEIEDDSTVYFNHIAAFKSLYP